PDLTREKFVAEMEKIKGFKGVGPEVNFKPFDPEDMYSRQGTRQTFLVKCLADGKAEKLTDWITLD
ncbi:MAG: ABC transporter substrate-binding protein, partial [Desulfotignum sp.]